MPGAGTKYNCACLKVCMCVGVCVCVYTYNIVYLPSAREPSPSAGTEQLRLQALSVSPPVCVPQRLYARPAPGLHMSPCPCIDRVCVAHE